MRISLRGLRPFLRRIWLLTLHLRHLANWMLLARCGKHGHRKENSEDALANQRRHNALAQLSASRRACKTKAQWWDAIAERAESVDCDYEQEHDHE